MKATGIVRKVDHLGRIVLPIEIRRNHGIEDGTPIEIFTDTGGKIVLRKYERGCTFCGAYDNIMKKFRNEDVCINCIEQLKGLV